MDFYICVFVCSWIYKYYNWFFCGENMREIIAISIITFWLAFPFDMVMMNVNDINTLDDTDFTNVQEPNALTGFTGWGLWDYVKVWFQILFMGVPNAPIWLNLIVKVLQLISLLILYILLRGI